MLFSLTTPFKLQALGRLILVDQDVNDALVTLISMIDRQECLGYIQDGHEHVQDGLTPIRVIDRQDGHYGSHEHVYDCLLATMMSIDEQVSLDPQLQLPIKLNDADIEKILSELHEVHHNSGCV